MLKKQSILYIFLFLGIANPSMQQAMPVAFWVQKMLVTATFGPFLFRYINKKLPKYYKFKNKTDKKLKNKYKKSWGDFHCELLKMLNNEQRGNILAYLNQYKKTNPSSARAAETNWLTVVYINCVRPRKNLFSYTM